MKTLMHIAATAIFWSLASDISAQKQVPEKRPLLNVIKQIENSSDMRFLYREALISDVKVQVSTQIPAVYGELENELRKFNIGLQIDEERNQALLFKTQAVNQTTTAHISGYVIDAASGDRLPYSTISWFENGQITGTASSDNGVFNASVSAAEEHITLLFSFVGYEPERVTLSLLESQNWKDIAVRLEPAPYGGNEIIVNGTSLFSPADTVYSKLLKAGAFSPMGDNNVIQALQTLPSVLSGPIINDGLNVRGSSSDGFRILLDGLTLYNQSHLFGLLDGLNGDVLRTSGFFYDITPAQYRAPLGGTLSFLTKTGNLQKFSATAGLSNTSVSSSIEGPLIPGKASFLFSGRHSYIDNVNWFNNQTIIDYGLDIDRAFDFQSDSIVKRENRRIRRLSSNAVFYDIHGKLYMELQNGAQIVLSSYLGKDNASQTYERGPVRQPLEFNTSNEWSNKMFNLSYNASFGNHLISETLIGFSDYFSSYFKEDNVFQRVETDNNRRRPQVEVLPLSLKNDLQEIHFNQYFKKSFLNSDLDFGIAYSDFEVTYQELSFDDRSFRSRRTSQLIDVFSQLDFNKSKQAHLTLGGRMYYFSNGTYTKWSPRIKAQFFPESAFSMGLGYSKNHQFLHRLDFTGINSTDFWIMANEDQPPSSVDYYTANIRIRPGSAFYLQVEGYFKQYKNLRIHSLSGTAISQSFEGGEFPFLFNNKGESKGVEFLAKKRIHRWNLASTYTLSSIQMENRVLNNGEPFYTDYDKRHQFSLISDLNLPKGWSLYSSWTFATGTPNILVSRRQNLDSRLDNYSRVDASIKYEYAQRARKKIELLFSVYNLLDTQNPWYSAIKQGISTHTGQAVLGFASIYDLERQTSFKLKLFF